MDIARIILAIDIGGTQYGLALVSTEGEVLRKRKGATDRAGGAEWMVERILEESRALLKEKPVQACGIGFGGPVEFASQRVLSSTHVSGWEGVPLPAIIERELDLPAVVENDANAGALGEFTFGAGRGCRHLVYYTISTGIGGGIVVDGEIYRGGDGRAGELGHVPVLAHGPLCDCGNRGCLEALCSGKSIGQRATKAALSHPRRGKGVRQAAGNGEITAKAVFDAARRGDSLAREIVQETCVYLGMGLGAAMNALGPDCIVVGGGVSRAGRTLFEPLRTQTGRFTMPVHRPFLRILPAQRGGNSVLLGAVALARKLVFSPGKTSRPPLEPEAPVPRR